jgi:hypothetical protein
VAYEREGTRTVGSSPFRDRQTEHPTSLSPERMTTVTNQPVTVRNRVRGMSVGNNFEF